MTLCSGSMLEKAGIDADKVRETIQNAFQKVKDFLITTWGVIKTVLTDGMEYFSRRWLRLSLADSNGSGRSMANRS